MFVGLMSVREWSAGVLEMMAQCLCLVAAEFMEGSGCIVYGWKMESK